MLWKSASYGICFLPYTTCSKRKPKGPLCRVRGSIRRIACRPLAIQANLLLVEDANDVAADFDELIWGFFNLCQSTQVPASNCCNMAIIELRNSLRRSCHLWLKLDPKQEKLRQQP